MFIAVEKIIGFDICMPLERNLGNFWGTGFGLSVAQKKT